MENIFTSEAFLALLGTIATGIFAWVNTKYLQDLKKKERWDKALRALESAVSDTYLEYVQTLKEGRADGSLTKEEAKKARQRALARAAQFAEREGVDLVSELGEHYAIAKIQEFVQKNKLPGIEAAMKNGGTGQ